MKICSNPICDRKISDKMIACFRCWKSLPVTVRRNFGLAHNVHAKRAALKSAIKFFKDQTLQPSEDK